MLLDRRFFCGGLVAATCASAGAQSTRLSLNNPRIPGEWEPTEAIWLSADVVRPDYMDASARLMQTLAKRIPLRLLVRDAETASLARKGFAQRGVDMANVPIFEHADVGFFIREAAQFAVDAKGRKAVLDLDWNEYGLADWCARYLYPDKRSRRSPVPIMPQETRAWSIGGLPVNAGQA